MTIKPKLWILSAFVLLLTSVWAGDTLQFDEFQARMGLEFGHLVKGEFRRASSSKTDSRPLAMVPLNRNLVFLEQSGQLGDSWQFKAGFMGVLWWPYTPEAGAPGTRTVRVEPRLSVAKARKYFGPMENHRYLELGYFPYKYNGDAANLGEYLYRSGTYPGVVVTSDGSQLMDHPAFDAYGVHLHADQFDGRIAHELNFFTEPVTDPIGDITPAYEFSLNTSVVQLGLGAAYNRGLSYAPSKTRPKTLDNAYIVAPANAALGIPAYQGPYLGAPSEIKNATTPVYTVTHYWTHKGLKLMGRAAVDLGFLVPEAMRTPGDLRLYTEVAVLGWENQPYYYEKRSQRIPIMFGMNVPTFHYLDLLAVQGEYYKATFNDIYSLSIASLPIWKVANYPAQDLDSYHPSPWRWSLYGKKAINRIVTIHGQIASDHLRLRDALSTYTEYELTLRPKNWYYLVRMEVGI